MNYEIYPKYDVNSYIKTRWTLSELKKLFDDRAHELQRNIDVYDGLFVIISCHGIHDYIITSDCKRFQKSAIHRIFSAHYPGVRGIPRLFLFDCCSGNNERRKSRLKSVDSDEDDDSLINAFDKEKIDSLESNEMF